MPRLREVRRADVSDPSVLEGYTRIFGERDPVDVPGTATGSAGNWWTVAALSPPVFNHVVAGVRMYKATADRLDPVLRELGQTRATWLSGSQFFYSQHCKECRALGMSEERISAISAWEVSDLFGAAERAVLAYTDALVSRQGRVPDAVFAELKAHLDDVQVLELTYITAIYGMYGTISRALRLEYDDVDDPVVEVLPPTAI